MFPWHFHSSVKKVTIIYALACHVMDEWMNADHKQSSGKDTC